MRSVSFHDLQECETPLQGTVVADFGAVVKLLEALRDRAAFFFELRSDDGPTLTVGLAREWGCVQYGRSDGEPPYLVACGATGGTSSIEFLAGGTPTPVAARHCLARGELLELLRAFMDGEDLRGAAIWEEV